MWGCYPNFMPVSELRISGGRNVENASASSIDTPKYATGQDGLFPTSSHPRWTRDLFETRI